METSPAPRRLRRAWRYLWRPVLADRSPGLIGLATRDSVLLALGAVFLWPLLIQRSLEPGDVFWLIIYFATALGSLVLFERQRRILYLTGMAGYVGYASWLLLGRDRESASFQAANTFLFSLCLATVLFVFIRWLLETRRWRLYLGVVVGLTSATTIFLTATKGFALWIPAISIGLPALIAAWSFRWAMKRREKHWHLFFTQPTLFLGGAALSLSNFLNRSDAIEKTSRLSFESLSWVWVGTSGLLAIFLAWLAFDRLVLTFWRRPLVEDVQAEPTSIPLSIYPDPRLYIDVHGNARWLRRFIERSDGGVLGLTGLRGAGKSALLNKVVSDLGPTCFTLHMTSPVHSMDRLEFFVMVCREVCSRVISEIESKIFRWRESVASKAWEGLSSRLRFFLALVLAAASLTLWLPKAYLFAGSFLISLGMTKLDTDTDLDTDTKTALFSHLDFGSIETATSTALFKAERRCLRALQKEIDAFLAADQSSFSRFAILPSRRDCLQLYPIAAGAQGSPVGKVSLSDLRAVLDKQLDVERDEVFTEAFSSAIQSGLGIPVTESESPVAQALHLRREFNPEFAVRGYYFWNVSRLALQRLYFSTFSTTKRLNWLKYWSAEPLSTRLRRMYRDLELNEVPLTGLIHSAAGELDVEPRLEEGTLKPFTWLFIEAFLTHHASKPETLLFERGDEDSLGRAEVLRDLVAAYLQKAVPYPNRSTAPIPPPSQPAATLPDDATTRAKSFLTSTPGLLLTASLLLLASGAIYRNFTFWMAAVVNFRAFGLWRESRDFLDTLAYTQTTEAGGSLSLPKSFGLSMKRVRKERDLTLPALTGRFIAYTGQIAALFNGKLVISIDELDKIDDPDTVRRILREIKGALFVPNVFYLISVSEDAARSFESRLTAGRDILESTFDELLVLDRLDSRQAWQLIRQRLLRGVDRPEAEEVEPPETEPNPSTRQRPKPVEPPETEAKQADSPETEPEAPAQPEPWQEAEEQTMAANAQILALFGGGVPREIVRNLREVLLNYDQFHDPTPRDVAVFLLQRRVAQALEQVESIPDFWRGQSRALRQAPGHRSTPGEARGGYRQGDSTHVGLMSRPRGSR